MSVPSNTPEVAPVSTTSLETPTTSQVLPTNQDPVVIPSSEPIVPALAEVVDPDEYELSLSEDSLLGEDDLNEIAEEAGRLNLSKEAAEKLIADREKIYKKGLSAKESEYNDPIMKAHKEITADPMFQGEAKAQTYESIGRALETFGDPELAALMKTPVIGNSLPLARFLKKIGDLLGPDKASVINGKGHASAANSEGNSTLRNAYPDFFKE